MKWSEEQAAAAERKVQENSSQLVCPEKQGALFCPQRAVRDAPAQEGKRKRAPGSFLTDLKKNPVIERGRGEDELRGKGAAF